MPLHNRAGQPRIGPRARHPVDFAVEHEFRFCLQPKHGIFEKVGLDKNLANLRLGDRRVVHLVVFVDRLVHNQQLHFAQKVDVGRNFDTIQRGTASKSTGTSYKKKYILNIRIIYQILQNFTQNWENPDFIYVIIQISLSLKNQENPKK